MTIKHKKKNAERPLESDVPDTSVHGSAHLVHHAQPNSSHPQLPVSVWPSIPVSRDEQRSSPYEEYEQRDSAPPPTVGKRRHRVSPHRSSRSKQARTDRGADRAAAAAAAVAAASPPSVYLSAAAVCPTAAAAGAVSPAGGPGGVERSVAAGEEPVARSHAHRLESDATGYNSGDEYGTGGRELTEEQWQEKERHFERNLNKRGLVIKRMVEDGACLFRAVSDQVFGDEEMHLNVRQFCMDYITSNADYFSQYITEEFHEYVNRKRQAYVHGNHIEIQAISEMYSRNVEVLCYSTEAINIFHGRQEPSAGSAPIRLSYHRGTHYNSVVNPYKATVGVGLGLPGLVPGLAEHNLMSEATKHSENFHIEQTMLEDKLKATDWEATDEVLSEQVARESYLQWLKDNEKRNKGSSGSSSTATSAAAAGGPLDVRSPRHYSCPQQPAAVGRGSPVPSPAPPPAATALLIGQPLRISPLASPRQLAPPSAGDVTTASANQERVGSPLTVPGPSRDLGFPLLETASFMNQLSPQLFGLSGWEDAGILARVLAESQQEYLDSLKKTKTTADASAATVDGAGPSTSQNRR